MPGTSRKFNGSTLSFGGTSLGRIKRIQVNSARAEIEVSGAEVDEAEFEAGIRKLGVTITCVGSAQADDGDVGALTVTWKDGGTKSLTNAVCISAEESGAEDGPIETTYTFRKAPAA